MPKYTIIGYSEYTTVQGDTFDFIALKAYTDEKMASAVIAANPDYSDVLIFDAGAVLRIPIISGTDTPETLPPWRRDAE